MLMFVAPALPEALAALSGFRLVSVMFAVMFIMVDEETEVTLLVMFVINGATVSTAKVTDWELFIWLKVSLIMNFAV